MPGEPSYNHLLGECLKDELKVVNAHLPASRKSLKQLLAEAHPHVLCQDGSTHLFSKKELKFLADVLEADEAEKLKLPMMIRVGGEGGEMAVLAPTPVEAKVLGLVLDMELARQADKVIIYRPQLAALRGRLRTVTQYVFTPLGGLSTST